jgi:hypothetical protein
MAFCWELRGEMSSADSTDHDGCPSTTHRQFVNHSAGKGMITTDLRLGAAREIIDTALAKGLKEAQSGGRRDAGPRGCMKGLGTGRHEPQTRENRTWQSL